MSAEYRVEFQITRRQDGEDDFTEVGFGSSGAWDHVDQAAHMAVSAVQNREWDTETGQPAPREIDPR